MKKHLKKLLIIGMLMGSFLLSGTGVLGSAVETVEGDVIGELREVSQLVGSPGDFMYIYGLIEETGSCAGSVADAFQRTLRVKKELDHTNEIQWAAEVRKGDTRLHRETRYLLTDA